MWPSFSNVEPRQRETYHPRLERRALDNDTHSGVGLTPLPKTWFTPDRNIYCKRYGHGGYREIPGSLAGTGGHAACSNAQSERWPEVPILTDYLFSNASVLVKK